MMTSVSILTVNKQSGFTLIEVMVALMILAVVAVAASQASTGYLRTVDSMRTRTLAHFVAQNTAAELKINHQWLSSASSQQKTQQGRTWQVSLTPSSTQDPKIQKVVINVAEVNSTNKTSFGSSLSITLSKPDESF